jgi:hypothetical protein
MTKNSADFTEWISGDFPYSNPSAWTYKISHDRVILLPSLKILLLCLILLGGFAALSPIILLSAKHQPSIPTLLAVIFVGGSIVIVGICGASFMFIIFMKNYWKGPYFIYSFLDHSVSLPRESIIIPITDILEWRLVSGNWFGPIGSQKRKEYPMSELQLVVKNETAATAYAVVGSRTESICAQAQEIARATHIPLKTVIQHQGVTSAPPPSNRVQWWRKGGM